MVKMSKYMQATLTKLVDGHYTSYHHGSLKALVKRGLAESYRSKYGTKYRPTKAGISLIAQI